MTTLRHRGLSALLLAMSLSMAHAETDLELVGLARDRAVLRFGTDGAPRVVRVGGSLQGVKLLEVNETTALIEEGGRRRTLELGTTQVGTARQGDDDARNGAMRVTLAPDASGHYITLGSINGQAIRFMVDTGATAVALGLSDARRLGINYRAGTPIRMRTANGIGQGYQVRLESVTLGNLRLSGIDAVVMEAELPIALLGMSFLNRTDMRQDAGNLVLTRRY